MSERSRRRVSMPDVAHGLRRTATLLEHGRPSLGQVAEAVEDVITDVEHETDIEREDESAPDHHGPADDHHTAMPEPPSVALPATPTRPTALVTVTKTMPPPTATTVNRTVVLRDGFTCATPYSNKLADVVVICCSSEKFELQHQELVRAMGFTMPHFIQAPGGPASLYGLAAIKGFMAKAMGVFVDKAVDLLGVSEVILIAHEDCGAYKSGRVSILAELTNRLARRDIKDVQVEHLRKAARELQARLGHGVTIHSFYGHIIGTGAQPQVRFVPVTTD